MGKDEKKIGGGGEIVILSTVYIHFYKNSLPQNKQKKYDICKQHSKQAISQGK